MNIELNTQSLLELKGIAYDMVTQKQFLEAQLAKVEAEIFKRLQAEAVTKAEVKKEEKDSVSA